MVCTGSERVGPRHHRGTAVEHHAGIDVSLERSSVCVVDGTGRIVREAKVASEPEALVAFFGQLGLPLTRVGLEAGPLSQWLHAGLSEAGYEAVLLETRHVKAALSAMIVKTDRKDARGIAQLLRMGWYRPVHRKSPPAQEIRALLAGRKLLRAKLRDVELSIRGLLRGFGLKVGEVSQGRFAARVDELVAGHEMLEEVIGAMLRAREGLRAEFARPHRRMLAIVRGDAVCRRLTTVPGVGALVAITFKAAVDDPARFRTAKAVGAHFGLTPKRYQSGETDVTGGISKVGDATVRTALYEAANAMLTRTARVSALRRWALEVARRRGMKRAKVALARKLAGVLQRMWANAADFRRGEEEANAADFRRGEENGFGAGPGGPAPPRSRRRDAGTGEAEGSAVDAPPGRTTRLRSARRLPSDRMMWRPRSTTDGSTRPATRQSLEGLDARRPVTEALPCHLRPGRAFPPRDCSRRRSAMEGTSADGWEAELERWLGPFLARLRRKEQRHRAPFYLKGLILPGAAHSVEPMAARVAPADTQQLHHFVSTSPWATAPLEDQLVKAADRLPPPARRGGRARLSRTSWARPPTGSPTGWSAGRRRSWSWTTQPW